jgi:hypothetical protein
VSSCLHPLQLSDLLLCLSMHTSTFSSSHRYASLFFSSSMLQLLHLMLLHACITHNNNLIPYLFCVFIFSLCTYSFLHVPCPISLHILIPISHLLCPDHHRNSSSSLAVLPMHSSSLGVMLRFLSLSSSRDSLSSLSQSSSFPLL